MIKPKNRLVSWMIVGLLCLVALSFGLYARKVSTEAKVVVEWSTASELDTVGFNLYRSDTPQGPGTRVNPDLIPPSADPQTGGDYKFTDTDVIPGRTYYYFLEDISASGNTAQHGPVEVQAEVGGRVELFTAIALMGVALFGGVMLAWPRRKQIQG
jgi:hypothetical protein